MTACRIKTLGMVNALGNSASEISARLFAGEGHFLTTSQDLLLAREVLVGRVGSDLPTIPPYLSQYASRNTRLTLAAYAQIAAEVESAKRAFGAERLAVILGSSTSGIDEDARAVRTYVKTGSLPRAFRYAQQEMGSVAEFLARCAGLSGPAYTISTACSSSAKVFSSVRRLFEMDLCDAAIVGGVDSLCALTLQGFDSLELLSPGVARPMSRNRDGINIGEGACLFLMTKELGGIQIVGIGESADAYHMSAPHPEGRGAVMAMTRALADARLEPGEIAYVNLHGTGTQQNDAMESLALSQVFGSAQPLSSSTKPLVGHLLGASGATEIGFCFQALAARHGKNFPVPPHCWDGAADPALPILHLASPGAAAIGHRAMSNSFAFGGSNCSVILERLD